MGGVTGSNQYCSGPSPSAPQQSLRDPLLAVDCSRPHCVSSPTMRRSLCLSCSNFREGFPTILAFGRPGVKPRMVPGYLGDEDFERLIVDTAEAEPEPPKGARKNRRWFR